MRVVLMVMLCVWGAGGLAFAGEEGAGSEAWVIPPIEVVDDKGEPLAKSEAYMLSEDNRYSYFSGKKADDGGRIQFGKSNFAYPTAKKLPEDSFKVLVLSPGKAPVVAKWKLPATSPLKVTVPQGGKTIELRLKPAGDKPVPADLIPEIVPEEFAAVLGESKDNVPGSVWPVSLGEGRYSLTVADRETSPLLMLVKHKGYLRGYFQELGVKDIAANGVLNVDLPAAGSVAMELKVPKDMLKTDVDMKFEYWLSRYGKTTGDVSYSNTIVKTGDLTPGTGLAQLYNDIAPGEYSAMFYEGDPEKRLLPGTEMPYRGYGEASVKSDKTTTVSVPYKKFDPSIFKGDGVAEITVTKQDGSPAANQKIRVQSYVREAGNYYVVTSGTLTDKGTTTITGLATGEMSKSLELVDGDSDYGETIGGLKIDEGETSKTFTFKMPPKAGDIAPDITLIDAYTSESVKLSDFKGQVIFLDFWATWCGPCQEPMAHNQKALEEHGARWGDKVAIVGASIDEDAQTVVDHVKKNGWNAVKHYWCGDGDWKAKPSRTYGVTGVPTAFLIDAQGKIEWRGHPGTYKLVEEIDKVLDGKQ